MFPGSVIRKLSHSEEVFAQYEVFTPSQCSCAVSSTPMRLSEAFDALVEAHPVLASHLERSPDGGWHLVADDLLHSGIWVVDGNNGTPSGNAGIQLDQTVSLFNLRLTLGEGESGVTVYVHHGLADGHHGAGLLDELLSRYTDVVTTGDPGPIIPQPAPESMETVLRQRGVKQLGMTGIERFLPRDVRL